VVSSKVLTEKSCSRKTFLGQSITQQGENFAKSTAKALPSVKIGSRGNGSSLTKIEHWHQGSISSFKIMARDRKGFLAQSSLERQSCSRFAFAGNRRANRKKASRGNCSLSAS
jgi:hypothetical protein